MTATEAEGHSLFPQSASVVLNLPQDLMMQWATAKIIRVLLVETKTVAEHLVSVN